jgi:hypothetical protein
LDSKKIKINSRRNIPAAIKSENHPRDGPMMMSEIPDNQITGYHSLCLIVRDSRERLQPARILQEFPSSFIMAARHSPEPQYSYLHVPKLTNVFIGWVSP